MDRGRADRPGARDARAVRRREAVHDRQHERRAQRTRRNAEVARAVAGDRRQAHAPAPRPRIERARARRTSASISGRREAAAPTSAPRQCGAARPTSRARQMMDGARNSEAAERERDAGRTRRSAGWSRRAAGSCATPNAIAATPTTCAAAASRGGVRTSDARGRAAATRSTVMAPAPRAAAAASARRQRSAIARATRNLRRVRRHPARAERDDVEQVSGRERAHALRRVGGRIRNQRHQRPVALAGQAVADEAECLVQRLALAPRSAASGGCGMRQFAAGALGILGRRCA